jgi:HK97 family phage prohead protease
MPYELQADRADCDGVAVVKTETNEVVPGGCHATEAEAQAQLTALNIAEAEERSIDLLAKMRDSAELGLKFYAEGKGGDGLTDQTVEEARDIAAGRITEDKVNRMAAWIARHRVDWEGVPQNSDPADERFPGPGAVAAYLWAVDPTDAEDADRVLAWVERYQASEEGEEEDEDTREEKRPMTQKPAALPVGIEYRVAKTSALTVREDGRTFSGYVALFDSPSDGLGFTEVIKPSAFNRTLSRANRGEANIVALYGHDPKEFLASTAAGNLTLRTDETGLIAELALPSTQRGNDLAALFDAGEAVSMGMSFGFSIPTKNGEKWDEDGTVRELREIRLHEVSLLSGGQTPAYPATIGLGSVRALANRLDVTPEEARDAVDALLSGDVTRTAILVRALGAEKEEEPTADAPVADEPAPAAIIEEVVTPVVPPSTLAHLVSIESRRK